MSRRDIIVCKPGAIVSAVDLPLAVVEAIGDLLIAFAATQQDVADRKRLLRLYGEAIIGFDAQIAQTALERLKLHNPRNPYRPTPQDVFESCERIRDGARAQEFNVHAAMKKGGAIHDTQEPFADYVARMIAEGKYTPPGVAA